MVVMARFRGNALRPVNSIKHVLDSEGSLVAVTNSVTTIANAVPNVDTTTFVPGDIRVGAKINGFFISVFVIGNTGAPVVGSVNWYIAKTHTGQLGQLPNAGNTGVSLIRNQIFHEEKGLVGSGDGTAMAFKGVIAIPRGMRRMREGDQFHIVIRSIDGDAQFCVKAIYKSYF